MTETEEHFPKKTRNKYLLIIIGLSLFCIIAYPLIVKTGGYDMNRGWHVQDRTENFQTALMGFLISIPIFSFFLGLIVALFPYRKLPYRRKYLRASLLTMLSINSLFSFGMVVLILMTLVGWYPPSNTSAKIFPGQSIKEQTIATFKTEMKALLDSTNFYLDIAITDHKAGKTNIEVAEKVKAKVLFFQNEIENKSKEFYKDATDAGLNEQEYEQAFNEVKKYMEPIKQKYSELKADGIDIN